MQKVHWEEYYAKVLLEKFVYKDCKFNVLDKPDLWDEKSGVGIEVCKGYNSDVEGMYGKLMSGKAKDNKGMIKQISNKGSVVGVGFMRTIISDKMVFDDIKSKIINKLSKFQKYKQFRENDLMIVINKGISKFDIFIEQILEQVEIKEFSGKKFDYIFIVLDNKIVKINLIKKVKEEFLIKNQSDCAFLAEDLYNKAKIKTL